MKPTAVNASIREKEIADNWNDKFSRRITLWCFYEQSESNVSPNDRSRYVHNIYRVVTHKK